MGDELQMNFAVPTTGGAASIALPNVKGSWKKKRIVTKIAKHKATKFGSSSKETQPTVSKDSSADPPPAKPIVKVINPTNRTTFSTPKPQHAPVKPKSAYVTSLFSGNPSIDEIASATPSEPIPDVKQTSNALQTTQQLTDTTTFKGLGLHPLLIQHLESKLNVTVPTRIQQATLAALVSQGSHKDCMVQAQTGSGKTLAYLLPIVHKLIEAETAMAKEGDKAALNRTLGTLAIVLAPTRELAKQINTVLEQLLMYSKTASMAASNATDDSAATTTVASLEDDSDAKDTTTPKSSRKHWIVPGLVVGGDKKKSEKARLRKGCTILVSTPGRLIDHLKTTQSFELGNLRWLVLDEADRFLELGFEETLRELLHIIDQKRTACMAANKRLSTPACWPTHKQILLTSATIKGNVARLAETSLKNPLFIKAAAEEEAVKETEVDGGFEMAKKASKGRDFIVKKEEVVESDEEDGDDDFWNEQDKIQRRKQREEAAAAEEAAEDDEEEQDEMVEVATTSIPDSEHQELFTVPQQLKQTYILVPAKLRLVTLVAVIRQLCALPGTFKAILFTDTCDSVDFLHHVLANGHRGPTRDEAEDAANNPTPAVKKEAKPVKPKPTPKKTDDPTTAATEPPSEPTNPLLPPSNDTLPPSGLQSPLFPACNIYKLHGNLPQKVRDVAYKGFRAPHASLLICTDVAARGLDLPDVSCVIQYDMPSDVTDYVHRIGRTARLGREGSAVSLLLPSEVGYVDLLARRGVVVVPQEGMKVLKSLVGAPVGGEEKEGKKGKGKEKKKGLEDWATDVQMMFERFVVADERNLELARSAFRSHVRAYTTHVSSEKSLFNIKNLHLGHVAKSFALRDAPGMSMGAAVASANYAPKGKVGRKAVAPNLKKRAYQLQSIGASASEFGDGGVQNLVGGTRKKVRVYH
ncbi:ATP-dependent RNA helicase dbp7 [Podochytrium sp. JEL0797]|nr:ATP-dependent RNA helicase dbp7 [Podochytrium sp. JEL0797]